MYELVEIKSNEVFTTSKIIAEGTMNQHESIVRMIQKYEVDVYEDRKPRFKIRPAKSGQKEKVYLLDEEQATFVITLLRNSKIVVQFKKNLVKQFYAMRRHLIEKQSATWEETRGISKNNRLKETDAIKQLAKYAGEQGSGNGDKLYLVYTKLANTIIDCKRDEASVTQLNNLTLIESVILQTIKIDMSMGMHYKDIYKDCKNRIETFKEITYMNGHKEIGIASAT